MPVLAVPFLAANGPDSWIWWSWVGDHLSEIRTSLYEHIVLTVSAVADRKSVV